MSQVKNRAIQGDSKEFLKVFNELCRYRHAWEVWADVITVMACSMANVFDKEPHRHEKREKEYEQCIKRLGGVDKTSQLFAITVEALERNPDQDFLGALYMNLELGSHWHGQFFTPYHVSRCMAEITILNAKQEIDRNGWISVCDPCIGGRRNADSCGQHHFAAENKLSKPCAFRRPGHRPDSGHDGVHTAFAFGLPGICGDREQPYQSDCRKRAATVREGGARILVYSTVFQ